VSTAYHHLPVLLEECLAELDLRPGALVIDGTLGGAGHAAAILERTAPDGCLLGLDRDEAALAAARERLAPYAQRAHLFHLSFRHLDQAVQSIDAEHVDAVLLDLGVSSHQLDVAERGFRFAEAEASDAPLDMRMDRSSGGPTAADLLRHASPAELQSWFQRYGELPGARRLARAIHERRARQPIETTADLLRVIREAGVGGGRRHNPATLVFQALRIAVNDELAALEEGLGAAIRVLRPGGRLVVIAYHSLEDRIVKQRLRSEARGCSCPPGLPACVCGGRVRLRVRTRRPLRPSEAEIARNPRARSARLRSAERVEEAA
jgi:16S rRNA (cytosine1402-N4)-methyltransferase